MKENKVEIITEKLMLCLRIKEGRTNKMLAVSRLCKNEIEDVGRAESLASRISAYLAAGADVERDEMQVLVNDAVNIELNEI